MCLALLRSEHFRTASTLVPNILILGVWSIHCYDYPASMLQFATTYLANGFPAKLFFYFRCFLRPSLFGLTILVGHSDVLWEMSPHEYNFGFYQVVVLWCTNKQRLRCTRHVCCLERPCLLLCYLTSLSSLMASLLSHSGRSTKLLQILLLKPLFCRCLVCLVCLMREPSPCFYNGTPGLRNVGHPNALACTAWWEVDPGDADAIL